MLIPTLYDDDEREYWHLVEHVGLWDVAVERQVEITGPDAARFTQLLTCRDLSRCDVRSASTPRSSPRTAGS
jgi:aminomethyltransferase